MSNIIPGFEKMSVDEKIEALRDFGDALDNVKKVKEKLAQAGTEEVGEFIYETSTWESPRMGPSCCWAITTITKKRNKNGDLVGKKVVSEPYPGMGEFPPSTTYYDADDNVVDEMP
jgi:hypothetical protein